VDYPLQKFGIWILKKSFFDNNLSLMEGLVAKIRIMTSQRCSGEALKI
jgi:hypothetical protein